MSAQETTPLFYTRTHAWQSCKIIVWQRAGNAFRGLKGIVTKWSPKIRVLWFRLALLVALIVGSFLLLANILMIRTLQWNHLPGTTNSEVSKLVKAVKSRILKADDLYTDPTIIDRFIWMDITWAIPPVSCHSHNDFTRSVPLFEAMHNGCTSVEADIWLDPWNSSNLIVSHSSGSLDPDRSLTNMYLRPLLHVLDYLNRFELGAPKGIYTSSPNTSLVLLIDFKTPSHETFRLVQQHLQPLRERGYLQSWNETSQSLSPAPVIIVASGDIDFSLITDSDTNQHNDIFMDAPLADLLSFPPNESPYNTSNSYYASSSLKSALGTDHLRPWKALSLSQIDKLSAQTQAAQKLGLKARYWSTPSWPTSLKTRVWRVLTEQIGVDVLNVDNLELAAKWDWSLCERGIWGIC